VPLAQPLLFPYEQAQARSRTCSVCCRYSCFSSRSNLVGKPADPGGHTPARPAGTKPWHTPHLHTQPLIHLHQGTGCRPSPSSICTRALAVDPAPHPSAPGHWLQTHPPRPPTYPPTWPAAHPPSGLHLGPPGSRKYMHCSACSSPHLAAWLSRRTAPQHPAAAACSRSLRPAHMATYLHF
jgi:hypothetical protein